MIRSCIPATALQSDYRVRKLTEDVRAALEREVEAEAEAARQAIRDHKRARCRKPVSAGEHVEQQRDVSRAVSRYIQLRRRLDELHAGAKTIRAS